jgi:signal transduction histidine kinase
LGLRSFSRSDKGEVVEADINMALRNTAKLLASQIKNRVNLHWDLCEGLVLRCNLAQLNQVFMNLMANALQAIEGRGNVWIRTYTETHEGNGEQLIVSIRDDGRGIGRESVDKIFDPFFTTKKVGEGTGLGLSIVYGIVERHHGKIQVRSVQAPEPEHGTEFVVILPLRGGIEPDLPVSRAS